MKSEELLDLVLNAISERHGEDTEAYDMRGISILADYFVATSATSSRQLHAIANSIIEACHKANFYDYRVEGNHDSEWLLVDLGDVVVNIFSEDARAFYNLEKLWADGKRVEIEED